MPVTSLSRTAYYNPVGLILFFGWLAALPIFVLLYQVLVPGPIARLQLPLLGGVVIILIIHGIARTFILAWVTKGGVLLVGPTWPIRIRRGELVKADPPPLEDRPLRITMKTREIPLRLRLRNGRLVVIRNATPAFKRAILSALESPSVDSTSEPQGGL